MKRRESPLANKCVPVASKFSQLSDENERVRSQSHRLLYDYAIKKGVHSSRVAMNELLTQKSYPSAVRVGDWPS
jgi:hypothetical protein